MQEKFMNFDDMAELCSEPGARTLFAGLVQLRRVLCSDVAMLEPREERFDILSAL